MKSEILPLREHRRCVSSNTGQRPVHRAAKTIPKPQRGVTISS